MNKRNLLLLLGICCFQLLTAQKLPSTLLWRISGNGLQKPSYLYGTMHLTDERIFNIGDSVYKAIEKTDGFATEIDPEQFTPFVIDIAKKSAMQSIRIKEMMQKDEFKKYGKALAKKLGKDEDEITAADILNAKNKWIDESYSKGKMQTFLDVYLLDIARRQGKWTGGVEDIQDQENLVDLVDESDIQELVMNEDNNNTAKENAAGAEMIKDYIDNNLNAIYNISYSGDSSYTDALLIKRNKKMAMRMDSLSRERSIVFAVGAAHLPGDKGVIELLKERGFTVEPVFSSKKIKPVDYKVAEVETRWYDVKDDNNYYSALMPGKAGNLTMYAILNMKMYFDVFKSTIYMTTAVQTPYTEKMADSVLGNVAAYYFGTSDYSKGKPITINNVPGREFLAMKTNYSHGYLLFKDGMMYIAIAMCMKKDTSAATPINKFLHSFTINQHTNNTNNETLSYSYIDKEKAYKILLPSEPKSANEMVPQDADSNIVRDLKISADPSTGAYYFFGTSEAAKGFSITNDKKTLNNIRESQLDRFKTVSIDTMYFKNGHRVLEIGGIMQQTPLMLKAHYEFRGNRWYAIVTMYNPAKANDVADNFFNSFQLTDYPNAEWSTHTAEDNLFTTWSPTGFNFIQEKIDEDDKNDAYNIVGNYDAFDSTRADNFSVIVETFNKYYWHDNDSTFWQATIDSYKKTKTDSLISFHPVANGEANGYEFFIVHPGSHNIKRIRELLNGNKAYSLITIQDSAEINNSNNNKFFESFRFSKVEPNDDLFTSKANKLLADISSTDSTICADAVDFLRHANFTKKDLPILHEAILKSYPANDYDYDETKNKLKNIIVDLEDSSSYNFSKDHYANADDSTKLILLEIMSSFKTQKNFEEIKNILLKNPPRITPEYGFINNLSDTAELTANILPDLFVLLKDSAMHPVILQLTNRLLNKNVLNKDVLKPYEPDILKLAEQQYSIYKNNDTDYDQSNTPLINILGELNNAECNAMLQKWSLVKDPYLQFQSVKKLLHNQQNLNPFALKSIAEDKYTRAELYDTLAFFKKEKLFPAQYLNQKSFAESIVYTAASDDDEPTSVTYLFQKVVSFKGKQAKFYFYKISYNSDDDDATYNLACAGPFSVTATDISHKDAFGSIYFDEDYDASKSADQTQALIKQMEDE